MTETELLGRAISYAGPVAAADIVAGQTDCGGFCRRSCRYTSTLDKAVIRQLRADLSQVEDIRLQAQTQAFCEQLNLELLHCGLVQELPLLACDLSNPGEAYLEWVFAAFRFGFSFNVDEQKSGWFMISSDPAGGTDQTAQGLLPGRLTAVLEFVVRYIQRCA